MSADAVIGTNVGGWQVLEPWITPSLFYKFLNKTADEDGIGIGMDSYSFCESFKNSTEANRWMRGHWEHWFNETWVSELAARKVERIRVPIGDWTINPYGPYIGCMDGSAEYVDKILDWAAAYNITVLLDVHTARGSQNGYDNGGRDWHVHWYENGTQFDHWDDLALDWLWDWDHHLNFAHMKWSVDQMEGILQRWGSHSAFIGLEPVNEPNYWTD